MGSRGQSSYFGVVLFTVVVVATSATTTAFVFAGPFQSADAPTLDLSGRVDG